MRQSVIADNTEIEKSDINSTFLSFVLFIIDCKPLVKVSQHFNVNFLLKVTQNETF